MTALATLLAAAKRHRAESARTDGDPFDTDSMNALIEAALDPALDEAVHLIFCHTLEIRNALGRIPDDGDERRREPVRAIHDLLARIRAVLGEEQG